MTTRGDARVWATALLRRAGDETAALDADVLLAHVCGVAKEDLYAHLDVALEQAQDAAYRSAVERRRAGEPVAYIRGHKEFFGLRFAVDRRVLIPRPETEVLVEAALERLRRTGRMSVADVGTGSGAIAVAIAASEPRARVVATDISVDALEVARANALAHGVADRVDLRHGDLLAPLDRRVDLVTANLPYLSEDVVPTARRPRREATRSSTGAGARAVPERRSEWAGERISLFFEPRVAVVAGADGLDVIRRCLAQLPDKLAAGGAILLECDPPQVGPIEALVRAAVGGRTLVVPDLTGAPRVVVGERE